MKTLSLSINPKEWYYFHRRKIDKAFYSFQQKIFNRDHYTCQFCGFVAKEYLEVVNRDGNYQNNKMSNMITACPLCTQVLFLEAVGYQELGGGRLIYLPEMEQQELNAFCHVLFCAITNGTGYRDLAQNIYRLLKLRAKPIDEKYGEGTNDPATFSRLFLEQGELNNKQKSVILKDIRLLPSYSKFKKQLQRWAELAAEEMRETRN